MEESWDGWKNQWGASGSSEAPVLHKFRRLSCVAGREEPRVTEGADHGYSFSSGSHYLPIHFYESLAAVRGDWPGFFTNVRNYEYAGQFASRLFVISALTIANIVDSHNCKYLFTSSQSLRSVGVVFDL